MRLCLDSGHHCCWTATGHSGAAPEPQTLPALIVLAALDSVQAEFFGLLVHLPESGVAMAGLCLEFLLACKLDQPVFIEAGLRERLLERG